MLAVCDGTLRESTSALIGRILGFGPQRRRDCQRCRCAKRLALAAKKILLDMEKT
jgi:hypothetical protein